MLYDLAHLFIANVQLSPEKLAGDKHCGLFCCSIRDFGNAFHRIEVRNFVVFENAVITHFTRIAHFIAFTFSIKHFVDIYDKAGKPCQDQTFQLIANSCKLRP